MKTNYDINIKDAEPEQLKYYKKLMLKSLNLPVKVRAMLRNNGNILTIGDLLDTSSLDLFEMLDKNYVLYKETKDILLEHGIELFAHSSSEAKKVKNRYHHMPDNFSQEKEILRVRNKSQLLSDNYEIER